MWMDLETIVLSAVNQTEKDKNHVSQMRNLKNMQMNSCTKQKQAQTKKTNLQSGEGNKLGVWDKHTHYYL